MNGVPILETRAVTRYFETHKPLFGPPTLVRAVDGVSLKIQHGETFAIVGESGCGKSTLARLMNRLLSLTSGSVHFLGKDIAAFDRSEIRGLRRDLQFIFQDPFSSLNPRMSVGRIVGEPIETHESVTASDRRERVADLLRRVGLRPEHADRYPHEFSGGQRQRIGIARALASGPKMLIGDEPVSALDVSIQAQVVNLLEDLREELGLTLVIIAHDLAVIRHMSDRIGVMYLGELVETAQTDQVFGAPLHPYTQVLLSAIPEPIYGSAKHRMPLSGEPPNPAKPPPGCRFHTRCPFAKADCRVTRPSLEDAGDGRQVACHFWKEIAASGSAFSLPKPTVRRPEVAQRFELFRTRSALKEAARSTTTQI